MADICLLLDLISSRTVVLFMHPVDVAQPFTSLNVTYHSRMSFSMKSCQEIFFNEETNTHDVVQIAVENANSLLVFSVQGIPSIATTNA